MSETERSKGKERSTPARGSEAGTSSGTGPVVIAGAVAPQAMKQMEERIFKRLRAELATTVSARGSTGSGEGAGPSGTGTTHSGGDSEGAGVRMGSAGSGASVSLEGVTGSGATSGDSAVRGEQGGLLVTGWADERSARVWSPVLLAPSPNRATMVAQGVWSASLIR